MSGWTTARGAGSRRATGPANALTGTSARATAPGGGRRRVARHGCGYPRQLARKEGLSVGGRGGAGVVGSARTAPRDRAWGSHRARARGPHHGRGTAAVERRHRISTSASRLQCSAPTSGASRRAARRETHARRELSGPARLRSLRPAARGAGAAASFWCPRCPFRGAMVGTYAATKAFDLVLAKPSGTSCGTAVSAIWRSARARPHAGVPRDRRGRRVSCPRRSWIADTVAEALAHPPARPGGNCRGQIVSAIRAAPCAPRRTLVRLMSRVTRAMYDRR
jgi:hypothetical protein